MFDNNTTVLYVFRYIQTYNYMYNSTFICIIRHTHIYIYIYIYIYYNNHIYNISFVCHFIIYIYIL